MKLTPSQLRVVEHIDGPLLVLAGPGAGKTRVVVERIKRLLETVPGHFRVLALTFTNKAANEMRERLQEVAEVASRAFIGTIHGFCGEVVANRGGMIGLDPGTVVVERYEDRLAILGRAVSGDPRLARLLAECGGAKEQRDALRRWLDEISRQKSMLRVPSTVDSDDIRSIYEAYDAEMSVMRSLDFDDILLWAYRILEEAPSVAAFYRRQFRYICVDEAQDMNEAQYRILCALCKDEHRNVVLVGDKRQAIYVWNGADPRYLDAFVKDFGAVETQLADNFRSSSAVVACASRLNESYKPEGRLPIEGEVKFAALESELHEAQFVTECIQDLMQRGHPDVDCPIAFERFAVLGRNRFVFASVEKCLAAASIPYNKNLRTGRYESESSLVRQFELATRVVLNPHDRLHMGQLAKEWGIENGLAAVRDDRPGGQQQLDRLVAMATKGLRQEVDQAIRALDSTGRQCHFGRSLGVLADAAKRLGDDERALAEEDIQVWKQHWDVFIRHQSAGGCSLHEFLNGVALGTTDQREKEGVSLLSVHSAKGMEFDIVFLIGMCDGVFPDYRARGSALDEERRSAFVAVTRARRLLYVTYPRERLMPWGDLKLQRPSPFFTKMCKG